MNQEEEKFHFVDLEPYLIPQTKILLEEIESKIPHKVMLRKVYDSDEPWQIRKTVSWHIDMPERNEGDKYCFTQLLLHIYFDFYLDMKLTDGNLIIHAVPFDKIYEDPFHIINSFNTMINNLQVYKMIPYFEKYNFPADKLTQNYHNISNIYKALDDNLKLEFDLNIPSHRYVVSLLYSNFMILKMYSANPTHRKEIADKYEKRYDEKFVGLRSMFEPIIEKWCNTFHNSKELIIEINNQAKEYSLND